MYYDLQGNRSHRDSFEENTIYVFCEKTPNIVSYHLQEVMTKLEMAKSVQETFEKSMQPEKTLSVCPISGVYMSSTDNEQRQTDHVSGKQFMVTPLRDTFVTLP
jgi:hypothetical protein